MAKNRRKKDKLYGPVSVLVILITIVSFLSLALSLFGIEGYKTVIANGTLESSLVTIKNIVSIDGIKFLFNNTVDNFRMLEPLVLIIMALLGVSICEKSGFLSALFSPLKRVKLNIIIFLTILIGVISTILGDYSYIFLLPFVGVMYKYLGKNPALGILIVFIGITIGYGTGVFFNYNDYLLGLMTESSAKVSIDRNYAYSLFSDLYIMIVSTLVLCIAGTVIIDKFLVQKLPKRYSFEEEELIVSKKAKKIALLSGLVVIVLFIYMILPIDLFGSGSLLDKGASRYMDKLMGENSPFGNGIALIITIIMLICGIIYGRISGNIKSSHEFSLGMSKTFENLGFMFVLLFFGALLISIVEWTNIGVVVTTRLVDFMSTLQFSGVILMILFFIITVLSSILIPSSLTKWQLMSPVVIPLFMQSNITPNMTQFLFKIADGVGKSITPIFIYYIITLAFLEKYRISEKNQVSIFGTLKLIMPVILLLSLVMLLLVLLWYIMGLPIGIGTYSTL